MNDRNGWIAIIVLTAGLLALSVFGGVQYANTLALTENWAAQTIEVEALRRSDILQQRQLAAFAEENAALKKQIDEFKAFSEQFGGLQGRQEVIAKTINSFALEGRVGQNIYIGHGAGPRDGTSTPDEEKQESSGSFNTAVGVNSFALNRTGAWNAALGNAALGSNEGGSNNLAAGASAMASSKGGSGNVALGSAAMYRNLDGAYNSAVGMQALYSLESGANNSAFGRNSLFATKRGSWNSAYGVDSLLGLETGEGNSAFGGEAGYTENGDHQHRSGSFNSWFGYQSGPATPKPVSNSVAIGYRAKNTDSDQTVIGNKETRETIIFGDLKVNRLCVGATCADAETFTALLQTRKAR